jgi:hypothetical protein
MRWDTAIKIDLALIIYAIDFDFEHRRTTTHRRCVSGIQRARIAANGANPYVSRVVNYDYLFDRSWLFG